MVLEPIYLDLSSSDDDDDDHNRAGPTALMYLSKVFHMDADDDDVRIIDKPTINTNVRRERARVNRSAIDDDDCCILDADPGADATPDIVPSLDTDELVMTGEKGPVACRDFPHARYLCVHFPFKTTLHREFCTQCHCYVCDSLAPCSLWGDGNNVNDHCHASEEPRWKTLRKVAKCGSVPSLATVAAGGSILQQSTIVPPITQSRVSSAVGLGASHKLQATVKRDPLIIKLKGKGRGKPSQPPHLGVRSSRPHRILPLSSIPGHRNRPPPPRSTSTPSRRSDEVQSAVLTAARSPQPTDSNPVLEVPNVLAFNPHLPRSTSTPSRRSDEVQSAVLTAARSPQPTVSNPILEVPNLLVFNPHPPRSTSCRSKLIESLLSTVAQPPRPIIPNPGRRRGGRAAVTALHPSSRSMPTLNPLPDSGGASTADILADITRPPGVQLPHSTLLPNATPHSPTVSPPVPNTPPSYTSLPPSVTIDVSVLQPPGADAAVQDFVSPAPPSPDRRYVLASTLRDLEASDVNMDLSTSYPEAIHKPSIIPGADYVAQRFVSPVNSAQNASSSHTVDILAGPIEGWEVDAAVEFDAFAAGISDVGTSPDQVTTSLNDVLQQMAGDDYLWGQFPGW
ncbi:hypothetical protein KC19_12G020500 [Ceratodon purpureus]|uniref:Uncharacterized protein n=1 Tax=Ceratodon purpureus TaxID=3225 RepID=A0A8T0G6Q0_CERPU|nr:hypothetical protein KC19_12G020500 [Ceratodon purpureus]